METKMLITALLFCCCTLFAVGHEFYSSIDEISKLVTKEKELLKGFRDYIQLEEDNLQTMKRTLLVLGILAEGDETQVNEPVAAYKLLRRLKTDWKLILKTVMLSTFPQYVERLDEEFYKLPSQTDLDGAASGIITLQETYLLYPENITSGAITGKPTFLGPEAAYHLAMVAKEQKKFQHAFLWAWEGLKQLEQGTLSTVTKVEFLAVLSTSAFEFGNLPLAIISTQQLVNQDPTNEPARNVLSTFKLLYRVLTPTPNRDIFTLQPSNSSYEALCRGEGIKMTPRRQRALFCRYSTGGGNPRLMYAPVKEEDEWDNPPIKRYHDIISEKEMATLKTLSRPKLSRTSVYHSEEGSGISSNRVSQGVFLKDVEDPVLARISQRIADITGLDMESADRLQVANYGVGGHFKPHTDSLGPGYFNDMLGDRIATVLIYLSDVQSGGATVFPEIGAALQVQKGSAVFWYNLLRSGEEDDNTLHAGCPVLNGSKWIANKWIHERGQEFRRQCSLSAFE